MLFRTIAFGLFLTSTSCITDQNQGLNPIVVQQTIVAQYPKIQKCYTDGIGSEGHAGIVKANFAIDKHGKAKDIRILDESLGTGRINDCLKREISAINFPKPNGGVDVAVTYPFKFEADKQLSQAAIMDVLRKVNTSLCYDEIAVTKKLKVKLTIGKQGRVQQTKTAFDDTELKASNPCLARMLQKQKFPKILSKQFETVSVLVTFEADNATKISEAR